MGRPRTSLLVVAVLCAGMAACKHDRGLRVPTAGEAIRCDGELDEPSWPKRSLHTGAFVDEQGKPAAPYSDARFLRDADHLYVGLYAADENITSATDAFEVEFEARGKRTSITFPVKGAPTTTLAGVQFGVDTDGTIDDPRDDDEEWIIEASVPLAELGATKGGRLHVTIRRCDVPKDGVKRCGSWQGELSLEGP